MPVMFSFDIKGAPPIERNRIQSFFERLGWENVGGSSYRYPRLGELDEGAEDWFNHIVPALMLFRSYVLTCRRPLRKYSLDVQSTGGYNRERQFGQPPRRANRGAQRASLRQPTNNAFGAANLRDWLDGVVYPYERT